MLFGNLQGLINGTEQIVFDYEVTGSPISSIDTGNILNGDEDGWYTIIARQIPAITSQITCRLNNDSGANYGRRGIYAENNLVIDESGTGMTGINLSPNTVAVDYYDFSVTKLYAKSGSVRLIQSIQTSRNAGTFIEELATYGYVWNNSIDNITSMNFISNQGAGFGAGTRIIILKTNNVPIATETGKISTPYIKGTWVRIGSQILTSPTSSITFSGLDGDRDVIYLWNVSCLAAANLAGIYIRPNNDSAVNYGHQFLRGQNSSLQGDRGTQSYFGGTGYGVDIGNIGFYKSILFAKSGFVRPCLTNELANIYGTTVTNVTLTADAWNNSIDNITSLVISASANFAIGSQFELYALRPNG